MAEKLQIIRDKHMPKRVWKIVGRWINDRVIIDNSRQLEYRPSKTEM